MSEAGAALDISKVTVRPRATTEVKSEGTSKAHSKRASVLARKVVLERQKASVERQLELEARKRELEEKIQAAEAECWALSEHAGSKLSEPIRPQLAHPRLTRPDYAATPKTLKNEARKPKNDSAGADSDEEMPTIRVVTRSAVKPPFDGDPLYFASFKSQFRFIDESKMSNAEKLNRLIESLAGRAADIVRPTVLMGDAGYDQAWKMLHKRFGDSHIVTMAWLDKLRGPQIKANDSRAIQNLSDDTRACFETLRAMKRLNSVTNDHVKTIYERLPFSAQNRWRKKATTARIDCGEYPPFVDFVEFLESVSTETNDPLFGHFRMTSTQGQGQGHQNKSHGSDHRTFVTETRPTGASNGRKLKCYKCTGEHKLVDCTDFQTLSARDKLAFVKTKKLCFNCISTSNHSSGVCRGPSCTCGSRKKHHSCLHDAFVDGQGGVPANSEHVMAATHAASSSSVALPIIAVKARAMHDISGSTECYANVLLDPGSTKTFCSTELVKKILVTNDLSQLPDSGLTVQTLTSKSVVSAKSVDLELSSLIGRNRSACRDFSLRRVSVVDNFPVINNSVSLDSVDRFSHLKGIGFERGNVDMIVGQDHSDLLLPLEIRKGDLGQPYAIRTVLGWTINGPFSSTKADSDDCTINSCFLKCQDSDSLQQTVEKFWKIDGKLSDDLEMSPDDKHVIDVWDSTVQQVDGHYQFDIPFKHDPPELPNNKAMAIARLNSLKARFRRDSEFCSRYTAEINDLLDQGFAEPVEENAFEPIGKTWYLPHHKVTNVNKPDKFRIVFDCSAEFEGTSLNNAVFQGPDLTQDLLSVLLKFRQDHVAIMGDIKGMYHQVKVTPSDRDALRFLWWPDGNWKSDFRTYRMTVHLFGGVWSPSAANYALQRTATEFGSSHSKNVVETVFENFYVDDCLKSVPSTDVACQTINELTEMLSLGGFHITKWISNSRDVIQSVPIDDRSSDVKSCELENDRLPTERALGVKWMIEEDVFSVKVKHVEPVFTKRGVLKVFSSVFDPLGFAGPFVMTAKLIFQDEVKRHLEWDEAMSPTNVIKWQQWLSELPLLENFRVPRCVLPPHASLETCELELHIFCDASELAYGAVAYLRVIDQLDDVHVSFLMAKSRLAPVKPMTVPRLELCAAVMAVKLSSILKRALNFEINKVSFWTDSMIVLQYIYNTSRRLKMFVANRVATIHRESKPSDWSHVRSELNAADLISRGASAPEQLNGSMWLNGPSYLLTPAVEWHVSSYKAVPMDKLEVKPNDLCLATATDGTVWDTNDLYSRYSSWFKLRKSVAWLRRFLLWVKNKNSCPVGNLSVDELKSAERAILVDVQAKHYSDELKRFRDGKLIPRKSTIHDLDPVFDGTVIRVSSRLTNSPSWIDNPIILPKESHVSGLIVRHIHVIFCHPGREYVLSELRRKFWVIGARALINRTLRDCMDCRRRKSKLLTQRMADLPADRVTPGKPAFSFVGIDCFGPFMVKRGRVHEKRYGCLFTCLNLRAIHIEKLDSLDANSFLNGLMRFIARRGVPVKIRCDNGSNFVGGSKELKKSIREWNDDSHLQQQLLVREIVWQFNPPYASHWGGVWERQIRSVRNVLNVILKDQVLDDERLSTVFCEAEAIVNNRPLTVNTDSSPITPNDLLLVKKGFTCPPGCFDPRDVFRRRWRHVQFLATSFWNRWIREYLPTLQIRKKWRSVHENLKSGDIVIVADESLPRNRWKLGKIVEVYHGNDGLVRSAKLMTDNSTILRPISKLCLLESDVPAQ